MPDEPLSSPQAYEGYIYSLSERYPSIQRSTPHPNDPALASTDPHHKHIPPDIKHHRVVAPDLSFARPNFSFLIEEIEREILGTPASGQ